MSDSIQPEQGAGAVVEASQSVREHKVLLARLARRDRRHIPQRHHGRRRLAYPRLLNEHRLSSG